MQRPPAHPEELTCPCCLPALGEFSEVPPHGGLPRSLGEALRTGQSALDFRGPRTAGTLCDGGFA